MSIVRLIFLKLFLSTFLFLLLHTHIGRVKLFNYLQKKLLELAVMLESVHDSKSVDEEEKEYFKKQWLKIVALKRKLNESTPDDREHLKKCSLYIMELCQKHPFLFRKNYFNNTIKL